MLFSEESKEDLNNEEESMPGENQPAFIMSSVFPEVSEGNQYSIQAEWGNGSSLSMGVSNVLLSSSWDRISSKNLINVKIMNFRVYIYMKFLPEEISCIYIHAFDLLNSYVFE